MAAALTLFIGCATERNAAGPATGGSGLVRAGGADHGRTSRRPVSTYSIVARDGKTGDMGVAVQSHWFSVGSIVAWAEAGVGAVATQSLVDVRYAPGGLALIRGGRTADQALAALLATDDAAAVRQVAMIDAAGRVGAHTGEKCIPEAGHSTGRAKDGTVYSCQANLMRNPTVPQSMASAFDEACAAAKPAPLAERLLAALIAAQADGGDIRGKQSAAILVVRATTTGRPWEDRLVDLRIEDHAEPVQEMQRLLRLHRAYEHMNAGDKAIEEKDPDSAMEEYNAARALAPGNAEVLFWSAVSLVTVGRVNEALPLLAEAYKDTQGDWRETLRRLPKAGLLPDDPALIEKLTR